MARYHLISKTAPQFSDSAFWHDAVCKPLGLNLPLSMMISSTASSINIRRDWSILNRFIHLNVLFARLRSRDSFSNENVSKEEQEVSEITAEAARVKGALQPLRLRTIGNINAGKTTIRKGGNYVRLRHPLCDKTCTSCGRLKWKTANKNLLLQDS